MSGLMSGSDSLAAAVERVASTFVGRIGVFGRDLRSGRDGVVAYNSDALFPTASMIKLPIVLELFRQHESGRLNLGDELVRDPSHWVGGSGVLRHMSAHIRLPIRDYAYLTMSVSDNVATNMLIDLVGIDSVNSFAGDLGLTDTRLRHKIDFGHVWDEPSHLGVGTPREFTRLMQLVYRRKVLSPESCDEMIRMMSGVGADRIGRFLPLSTYSDELRQAGRATGPTLRLAGKTGGLIGVRGHTAVVWGDTCEFVLTVMTEGSTSNDWGVEHDGVLAIARIGKLVHDAWSGPADLASTDTGRDSTN